MVRPPRKHVPDEWYHLMSRGNGGEVIHRGDQDRQRFLGLAKEDQRWAEVVGCTDPGTEVVARRPRVVREHRWSSWRADTGFEPALGWLTQDRIQSGGGRHPTDLRASSVGFHPMAEPPVSEQI